MTLEQKLEQNTDFLHVGKSHIMMEAPLVVSANALYPSDIQLPKMLHGKILRSPHPHAKIISIDTSEAEKMPGVKAVITGKDLPDVRFGSATSERYILAHGVVRFVGEAIAAVAAIDTDIAEEATKAIKVSYEMLPAVYDAEEALKPTTPTIVHPDFESYSCEVLRSGLFGENTQGRSEHHQLLLCKTWRRGERIRGSRHCCGKQILDEFWTALSVGTTRIRCSGNARRICDYMDRMRFAL